MKRLLITFCTLGIAAVAIADEVDIPNQFTAGTPAVAADVNANFAAVEVAVDDNAQRVVTLETGLGTAGIAVKVAGAFVGRYLGFASGFVQVDRTVSSGGGTELVARAINVQTSSRIFLISATGYTVKLMASDFDHPILSEGNIDPSNVFYDGADCTGNTYFPVEGDTGWFSTFTPSTSDTLPLKRWSARQGFVFASPDPNDMTPVYMMRRGEVVQTVALGSRLVFAFGLLAPLCLNLATMPGYDITNPLHVDHTVVPIEANDPAVSGVSNLIGGQITVGL